LGSFDPGVDCVEGAHASHKRRVPDDRIHRCTLGRAGSCKPRRGMIQNRRSFVQ
jgi:hypothetical protein